MQLRLLPCPRCDLPNPRLHKYGGRHCGARIWDAKKSEAIAEWNGEPVDPALDA